jgi:penicillin-binding protein 1A
MLGCLIAAGVIGISYLALLGSDLHGIDVGAVPQMEESTKVFDRHGKPIYEFFEKKRTVVPLSEISPRVLQAILAVEDREFFEHDGYSIKSIGRAALANIRNGRIQQGGSTITQQLARNTFLSHERSFRRKLEELWLAMKIEHAYTKEEILAYYANRVYLGTGYYGVEAASEGYFGKRAAQLDLHEAATLAALVKAPAAYSPYKDPEKLKERRDLALDCMALNGYIDAGTAARAKAMPLQVKDHEDDRRDADYAIDYILRQLLDRFGHELTYNGGLRVYTTIDSDRQKAAEQALERHLAKLDQRLSKDRARNRRTRRAADTGAIPDVPLQGALLSIDAGTGEMYAIVGGRNYEESKFNRAIDARRQPGSAFKPLVFAAALERGMNPADSIDASPMEIATPSGMYQAVNADDAQYGSVTLRTALIKSINTAAIQLGQKIGLDAVLRTARSFGLDDLPRVPSLPLGSGEVTLLALVRAYSAFPNQGKMPEPYVIRSVETTRGRILFQAAPSYHRATDPAIAFLATTMLEDVVSRGTGAGVRSAGFRGPVGGKTGTTNDWHDGWFIGFTPDVVTGVWVGYDEPRPIMRNGFGATLALPIWVEYMKKALGSSRRRDFPMPPGVLRVPICSESGKAANPGCHFEILDANGEWRSNVYTEYFRSDSVPSQCPMHGDVASDQVAGEINSGIYQSAPALLVQPSPAATMRRQ